MPINRSFTNGYDFVFRSYISGGDVRIDKDPDMTKLAQEARRLSMGGNVRRTSGLTDQLTNDVKPRTSISRPSNGGYRRPSEGFGSSSPRFGRRESNGVNGSGSYSRRQSETPPSAFSRRTSESLGLHNGVRRASNSEDSRRGSSGSFTNDLGRRPSSSDDYEADRRRMSEAGMRRQSTADVILNEDTTSLMVGMQVWVDGTKHGRIAFIGNVHFTKGEVAGVHLESPLGKNNGTVGGIMYFQCEPKHGVFARLHRLTREPLINEDDEYEE